MEHTKTIEANPNTKVQAHWYTVNKEEFKELAKVGVESTSPAANPNGVTYQKISLKNGNILFRFFDNTYKYVKFLKN